MEMVTMLAEVYTRSLIARSSTGHMQSIRPIESAGVIKASPY